LEDLAGSIFRVKIGSTRRPQLDFITSNLASGCEVLAEDHVQWWVLVLEASNLQT
jgi:hypothetical protein